MESLLPGLHHTVNNRDSLGGELCVIVIREFDHCVNDAGLYDGLDSVVAGQ